jgi:hypothetical protein
VPFLRMQIMIFAHCWMHFNFIGLDVLYFSNVSQIENWKTVNCEVRSLHQQ